MGAGGMDRTSAGGERSLFSALRIACREKISVFSAAEEAEAAWDAV